MTPYIIRRLIIGIIRVNATNALNNTRDNGAGLYPDGLIKSTIGIGNGLLVMKQHDTYGPYASHYNIWMRRVKMAFDPNEVSESTHFIPAYGPNQI